MKADYVIVGTGSAGSALAHRLSAHPRVQVVVLESGERDPGKLMRVPRIVSRFFRGAGSEDSVPPEAVTAARGFAADYDEWGQAAGEQWSFAGVKKYFERIESGPLDNTRHRVPADAYLQPALRRPNLRVRTGATATRVLFDGKRAAAVEFEHDGHLRVVVVRREVVLCCGAVNTPQLLMLSGIGPADQLAEHGIAAVHDAAEVGANLADPLAVPLVGTEKPRELAELLLRLRAVPHTGESGGFVRSRPDLELPDLKLIFAPAPSSVVVGPLLLKPHSRGRVTLRSADPTDTAVIEPRYLTDTAGADRAALLAGLRMCASIAKAPAQQEASLRRTVDTLPPALYQPVGTCRMGSDDGSVVDPQLRVRGVHGLRVADPSVMPAIVRGHTHAPSVLIGEKAADLLRSA